MSPRIAGAAWGRSVSSVRTIAEVVLAEGLEVVQQALDQRCGGRRMAAFVACSIMEAVEQGLPGAVCRGLPAKLRAFTGTGEHHDGDRVATDCGAIWAACCRYAVQAARSLGTSDITPQC